MIKKTNIAKKAPQSPQLKSERIIKICEIISKKSIYLLVFLLPIFFLPWTMDVLDFNKQALLIFLVFVSLFGWLVKSLASGSSSFNLSWISLPVIILFLVFLISTIFSSFPYGSFWGWPQVISESFLALIGLTLLYFLIINIFKREEIFSLIKWLVLSCFLAMLYGIFQLFGKFIFPFDFTKTTGFNTIGTVNNLGVFTAVLLPLIIILLVISRKTYLKTLFVAVLALSLILLVMINFQTAWWLVIAGAALVITLGIQKREFFDNRLLILPMFFLAVALFFSLFGFRVPGLPDRPLEVPLTQEVSRDVSWKALKENPILGSGPGTFVYNFSKYKDIRFNQSPFWNIRFQRGGSRILTLLGTDGILGALSFLALIGLIIFYGIKSIFKTTVFTAKETGERLLAQLGLGIFISFIILSIGYFIYQSNLSLDFVFFFLIACFISLIAPGKKDFLFKPSSLITLGITFSFTLVFIFGLGILILGAQKYVAEADYLRGLRAWQEGNIGETIVFLEKAVRINPKVDLYRRELSQVYLGEIEQTARRTDLSQEEATQRIQFFISSAINSAKSAVDINPDNVANWSVQGFIYQNLIGVVGGTREWALRSYDEASKLEPLNPYFPTQSGISLLKEASFLPEGKGEEKEETLSRAQSYFKQAIELKSDYAPAHFQLAGVYQEQGKQIEAIGELERARDSAPFDIGLAFQLGLIYYQNEEYQKARLEFEKTVSLNLNYANALYFLGLSYDQLGDKEKAIEKFKRVSALNPDNSEVKRILENLRAGRKALAGITEEVPPEVPIEEEHAEIEE